MALEDHLVTVGDLRGPTVARLLTGESTTRTLADRGLTAGEYVLLALRASGGLAGRDGVRAALRGVTAGPLPVVVPAIRSLQRPSRVRASCEGVRTRYLLAGSPSYGWYLELLATAAGVLTDDSGIQ